jgi:HAD superfamily hydrolase (TIGR01509 family)
MAQDLMTPRFHPPADTTGFGGLIFDCDGTLVDSMPVHFVAWRTALSAAGAHFDFSWDEFLSRAGMSLERTTEELETTYGCTLDRALLTSVKAQTYEALEHLITPIDEVIAFAHAWRGKVPMAVATGSRRSVVERILQRMELLHLFETVVTPADVTHGKPDPDMFLLAAARLGVAPEQCLVLEDGASGFEAARRAGMRIAVVQPGVPLPSNFEHP